MSEAASPKVINFTGYKPKPWQKVVHDAITAAGPKADAVFVAKSPRQIGKSLLIEMELLRHAMNYKGSVSICVSITFPNCSKIFKELEAGIADTGLMAQCDRQALEITLINGSKIIFKSAQQRESLRGYTIKRGGILCIDEAAYIPDEIFGTILPWTNVHHANTLIVSTPRIKQGTFYEYYTEGLNGSKFIKSFDLSKFDTSEMLSPEKVEMYRRKMSKRQFLTEILGEFSDSGAGVFDISKDIWLKEPVTNYTDISIGIDWATGSGNDDTVLSGFDLSGRQVMLHRTNQLSPTEQIDWIVDIINRIDRHRIRKIVCERNSIGTVYLDLLKKRLPGYPIEEFVTSNSSKRDIIERLISRVDNETIKLINDKEQYLQFGGYALEITSSGAVTYNGLPGVHDDIVLADAFAIRGITELESSTYAISFGRRRN
mgnify:FL=1